MFFPFTLVVMKAKLLYAGCIKYSKFLGAILLNGHMKPIYFRRLLIALLVVTSMSLLACTERKEQPLQGYIDSDFTYITSEVGGKLQSLSVGRGDWVDAGKQLFTLEQAPQSYAYQAAQQRLQQSRAKLLDFTRGSRETIIQSKKADLAKARADWRYAEQNWQRHQKLYKQNAIDKDALDRAQKQYAMSRQHVSQTAALLKEAKMGRRRHVIQAQQHEVERAQDQLASAHWRLSEKTITAPVDGYVYDDFYQQGESVQAGKPVLALINPANEKVVFYISEPLRSQLHREQTVTFTCDRCQQSYQATINYIARQAEFTPPVIFSRKRREKLVYRVEAGLDEATARQLNTGQPVDVYPWPK
jgi:HlyD family secretion protein